MRIRTLVVAAYLLLIPALSAAQERPDRIWQDLGARKAGDEDLGPVSPRPVRYHSYAIALDDMRAKLAQARVDIYGKSQSVEISLPRPDGKIERFRANESPVLGPEMQHMLPDVRTYAARGIDDPTAYARIDLTRLGLRAYVLTSEGTYAVDPLIHGRTDRVMSHWAQDGSDLDAPFDCQVIETPGAAKAAQLMRASSEPYGTPSGDTLRTFRYTLTTGGEYNQFFGGDTLVALAEMVTVVNRVNGAYERDLAVHLNAVFLKTFQNPATDPFADGSNVNDLSVFNQILVDSLVGVGNYDVGVVLNKHAAPLGHNGVGLYPAICEPNWNASTVITSANPVDLTTYRIVMHEMGHNFFSLHDWDAPCNRARAFEPGSGSTIMGRAGRCQPYNIQAECDHYFSGFSMVEIMTYLRFRSDCSSATPTGNAPPTANAGPDYTIPRETPFVLTAQGADPTPGDTLTFCWEQEDEAPTPFDLTLGPLVRTRLPGPSPVRYYPLIPNLLSNTIDPWDKLATVNRIMTMRLTVRGASVGFGGSNSDIMVITVAGAPFAVTSPNGGNTLSSGVPFPVTWTVGGGSVAPLVNILVSTDGGNSWNAAVMGTPNDGSEAVFYPVGVTESDCRVKVEAVGNIFYDVSNADFTLTPAVTATQLALFQAEGTSEGIAVRWRLTEPAEVAGVRVERTETGVAWSEVAGERREEEGVTVLVDRSAAAGQRYGYRLVVRLGSGEEQTLGPVWAERGAGVSGLAIETVGPTPARGAVRIGYALPRSGPVRLEVLDVQGRVVTVLAEGEMPAGRHEVEWSGASGRGRVAGLYYIRLRTAGETRVRTAAITE